MGISTIPPIQDPSPSSCEVRTPTHATPRFHMVELDLEQILDTTDTIVQELLATGEFG